jgi:hypothetical protein
MIKKSRLFPGITGEALIEKMKLHKRELAKRQYEMHGDIIRARCRASMNKYYAANKEKIVARRTTEAYKKYHKEYMQTYLKNNAERLKFYRKEYYQKNKERMNVVNALNKKKRAEEKKAAGVQQ